MIFSAAEIAQAEAYAPQPRDTWLPVIEVMAARDQAGSAHGWYVAAKGGHNNESHNHNDIGEFVVYRDGLPLLIDAGVETYSRKTFSPQRYEIWTMQSAYHNLPTIDGVQQAPGEQFAARDVLYQASDERRVHARYCRSLSARSGIEALAAHDPAQARAIGYGRRQYELDHAPQSTDAQSADRQPGLYRRRRNSPERVRSARRKGGGQRRRSL